MVKCEVVPVNAMKAYRQSGCTVAIFLHLGSSWMWVVSLKPWLH